MPADPPLTASSLLGRRAGDGRVVDLVLDEDDQGRMRVTAAVVTSGPWGRLLGYERAAAHGPWLLEVLARAVLRRSLRRVPLADIEQ